MTGNEQIAVDYEISEPPARVWRALTDPKLLAAWLMPSDIAPVVGHKFTFQGQPRGDWNGVVDCEVLEVISEKHLVYSWNGGSASGAGYVLETTVAWTLEPRAHGGTKLSLVHHGFHPDDFAFRAMGQGWRSMGASISRAFALL